MNDVTGEVFEYWETKYGTRDGVWSGRVNAALAEVAESLEPGTALDLGSGEGGDALWLAERGWTVTGVDVSPTALARAEVAADRAGLTDRVTWVAADLDTWSSDERFDLVTASFLHSPVALDREHILRAAADRVAEDGHLLIVAHAEQPPWTHEHEDDRRRTMEFPTPEEDLAALQLPGEGWQVRLCELRDRRAFAPDGSEVVLRDGVLLVQRVA